MSEHEHTHRLVGGGQHRRTGTGSTPDTAETYEPGDPITPTEAELDALPDRFEPLPGTSTAEDTTESEDTGETADDENDESGASDDASTDESERSDTAEDGEQSDESGESDTLTAERINDASYQELRSLAGQYDDINGNWGEDRLRTELLTKTGDGGE